MLQQDDMVRMVMKVLVAMVMMMMIPMKPSSMTMAMISPSRKKFSQQISACGEHSLCVCFPPRRGGRVFLRSPWS
jgi:hypothetical protein